MLENVRDQEPDLQTVWCAHCSWTAARTWPKYLADQAWPMRVLEQHIRERHPERLEGAANAAP